MANRYILCMSLPVRPPVVPNAADKYSVAREASNAKCLRELKDVVEKLITVLDDYAPKQIVDSLGNQFDALAKSGGAVALVGFPWQVLDNSDDDGLKCSVPTFSAVYSDPDMSSHIVITGMDSIFDVTSGDALYAEIPIKDGDVDPAGGAELKCGAPWPGYPLKYKTEQSGDPLVERQTKLFIPIAYFGPTLESADVLPGPELVSRDETLQTYQLTHTHLMLLQVCGLSGGLVIALSAPGGNLP